MRVRLMSSLLCLSHFLLNSNGAAQNKQTKNCQESQVIALPGNEYPESPAVFLANSKQTPNFWIPRGGGDCSETLAGILPVGSVTKKKPIAFGSFSFFVMKEPFPFPESRNCCAGEGRTRKETEWSGLSRSSSHLSCLLLIFSFRLKVAFEKKK